jgi:hypothetical protein
MQRQYLFERLPSNQEQGGEKARRKMLKFTCTSERRFRTSQVQARARRDIGAQNRSGQWRVPWKPRKSRPRASQAVRNDERRDVATGDQALSSILLNLSVSCEAVAKSRVTTLLTIRPLCVVSRIHLSERVMIGCLQRGGSVMARQRLERKHDGSAGWRAHLLAEDWPLYVALLPAALTSAVIGIAAAVAVCSASSWPDRMRSHVTEAKPTPGVDDDYVEGLVKRGLAELPYVRGGRAWTGGCALTQVR